MTIYNEQIKQFITNTFSKEDEAARRAREDSPALGLPDISIAPEEGKFLSLLTAASGGMKALEIGTLGGYSAIWIARGLKPGGKLVTIDIDPHHTKTAAAHLAAAGLADRVTLITGSALDKLSEAAQYGPFDFVFIDADKDAYKAYYEWSVDHVRPGGIIAAHNAFKGGRILSDEPDESTIRMRGLLEFIANDERVISSIYPGGDGTLIAVKKD